MALTGLRDESIRPFAQGRVWGPHGSYEAVSAVADFAVDPHAAANHGIVDLERAADPDGLVRFDADLRLLRPSGRAGNGRLLFVIANRGLLGGVPFSAGTPLMQIAPLDALDPGDGFLLAQGWTIAWCGWQWDVTRGDAGTTGTTGAAGIAGIGLRAPTAAGVEPGWIRVEFRPDADQGTHALSDSSLFFTFTEYPTADIDDPQAVLTEQLAPDAPPRPVERERWRFVDERTVALDGGFQAFHWYTLTYRTSLCPVVGTGLLAVRDAVSWLRRDGSFTHAFGYGVSQSGRFLRQFLHEGRNVDEGGAAVFDGVLAHIAGARRGEFNHRYAQPSLTHPLGFPNLPPYDTAGLLEPQRALGAIPKLFLTNSSWEYWRGDGALVHVDSDTGDDLPDDPDARVYLLAGTDHFGAMPTALKELMPAANPVHDHDVGPVLRALFVALVQWACDGVEPPPSQVPRHTDGTATTRAEVLERFAAAGAAVPDLDALNITRDVDLGPQAAAGVGRWPLRLGAARPAIVPAIDAGGNEIAGVALPAVAVPVAAYTGWNPRRPVPGLPTPLYEFLGSRLPLLTGPPAFADRDDYETAVRAAARRLVAARFLMAEDVEATVGEALAAYDRAADS
ncbi:hypothetical protein ACG83_32135 [Frankia sp. R43]|uniref:alpha/beta hydrolase domain-containing protein n=1 Tax=Frankia sp. R43 TaxID=269536 RepID=UPI0006CA0897|nr:alpha/beta hydrolase domain-containing protein [Frankia sp. R43]KPM52157.1 hypothetical protein ACG83_32135 [Frankia sp. R43]